MKKILCIFMCIILIVSFTACSANDESQEEKSSNKQVPENRQFNEEPTNLDPTLKELADVILENKDVFGDSDGKKIDTMAVNEQMLNMMNQNMGSNFLCGINIFSGNSNITIYQSSNSEVDAELLKNFEGFNRENRPMERPEIDEKDRPQDSENFNNSRFNRGIFDFEDSDIKILGNYIIIANTENNEEVFNICESHLSNN